MLVPYGSSNGPMLGWVMELRCLLDCAPAYTRDEKKRPLAGPSKIGTPLRYSIAALIFVLPAFSANWYVHKGATGSNNGTSWTNAWNEMNQINFSSVACGDTVWLGGGTYSSSMTVSKSCTSSTVLTIQSVISSDSVPTTAAGYTSAVLGQVVMNGTITINAANYITINGRHGTIGTEGTFGIAVECNSNCDAITVGGSGAANNVTLTELELYGPSCVTSGGNGEGSCSGDTHGVDHGSSSTTNLVMDHMWMHRFAEIVRPYQWTNYMIQYCDLDTTRQTPDEHEDLVYAADPSSGTMRYNVWWGSPNDGIFFDFGGNSLTFYGNVMFHNGGAMITFKTGYNNGAVVMYNNTFSSDESFGDYTCPGNCPWIDWTGKPSSISLENNIFDHVAFSGSASGNYNAFSSDIGKSDGGANSITYSSAFAGSNLQFVSVNLTNMFASNFQLTSSGATTFQNGATLPSPYNVDLLGDARGGNGHWYMGAYQYGASGSGGGGTPTPPSPPTNLTVTVQ